MKFFNIICLALSLFVSTNINASVLPFQDEVLPTPNFSWSNKITSSLNINNEILTFSTEDTIFFDASVFSSKESVNLFFTNINDVFNSRIETVLSNLESYSISKSETSQKPVPLPASAILLFSSFIGLLVFKRQPEE